MYRQAALGQGGTSPHYRVAAGDPRPHPGLAAHLERHLERAEATAWHWGVVWTTDAFFRETKEAVLHYQARGVLGVDLEIAAVFAVGEFRGLPVAAVLVVSDELFTLTWHSRRRSPAFKAAREAAGRLALTALANWGVEHA